MLARKYKVAKTDFIDEEITDKTRVVPKKHSGGDYNRAALVIKNLFVENYSAKLSLHLV